MVSGSIEILLNSKCLRDYILKRSELVDGKTRFTPVNLLGGASSAAILYDMDGDGDKDILTIDEGASFWYEVSDPNECEV